MERRAGHDHLLRPANTLTIWNVTAQASPPRAQTTGLYDTDKLACLR